MMDWISFILGAISCMVFIVCFIGFREAYFYHITKRAKQLIMEENMKNARFRK